jgi:hypothetical protein
MARQARTVPGVAAPRAPPSPEGDERRVKEGRAYERMRRPASVLEATERELSNA